MTTANTYYTAMKYVTGSSKSGWNAVCRQQQNTWLILTGQVYRANDEFRVSIMILTWQVYRADDEFRVSIIHDWFSPDRCMELTMNFVCLWCWCEVETCTSSGLLALNQLTQTTAQHTDSNMHQCQYAHTHTHTRLTALCPRLPRWAGTRKEKPIWILLKQETMSGSGISWAICKSAPRSRQITTPAPHRSVFLQAVCPSCRPTNSVKALVWKIEN